MKNTKKAPVAKKTLELGAERIRLLSDQEIRTAAGGAMNPTITCFGCD